MQKRGRGVKSGLKSLGQDGGEKIVHSLREPKIGQDEREFYSICIKRILIIRTNFTLRDGWKIKMF